MTIVQISGEFVQAHAIDVQWRVFCQHIKASISLIVFSITASRLLFGMRAQNRYHRSEDRRARQQSYRQRLLRMALHRNLSERSIGNDVLPTIPRATLTGMCTLLGSEESETNLTDWSANERRTIYKTADGDGKLLRPEVAYGS